MRKVVSVPLIALTSTLALTLTAGCGDVTWTGSAPGAAPATASPSASPLPTVPDVVGRNAEVAKDTLTKAGFTHVSFGTVDGRAAVLLPQNWTVRTQSAKAGTHQRADAEIVLGCARNGGPRWPWLSPAPTTK